MFLFSPGAPVKGLRIGVDGSTRRLSRGPTVEQRVVYSIYYNGTLVLPWRGERGVALAGCVWVRVE